MALELDGQPLHIALDLGHCYWDFFAGNNMLLKTYNIFIYFFYILLLHKLFKNHKYFSVTVSYVDPRTLKPEFRILSCNTVIIWFWYLSLICCSKEINFGINYPCLSVFLNFVFLAGYRQNQRGGSGQVFDQCTAEIWDSESSNHVVY